MKHLYWRQVIASVFPRIATILLGFLLARLLVGELGAENYGDWAAISNIFVASSFLTFGVASSFINHVILHKDKSPKKLAILFTNTIAIAVISSAALIVLAASAVASGVVGSRYYTYIPLCIAVLIVSMVLCLVNSVYQGLSRIQVNEYAALSTYVLLYLGVRATGASNTTDVLLVYLMATFAILAVFGFPVFIDYFVPRIKAVNIHQLRKLLSPAKWFLLSQLFSFVLYGSGRVLVLILIGPASVTDYDLVMKMLSPLVLVTSLALAPTWSYFGHGSKREVIRFFVGFEIAFLIGLLLSLITVGYFPEVIALLFKHQLKESSFIIPILISIAIQIHTQPYCYYMNAKGRVRVQAVVNGIAALANIALSIVLAKDFGLQGIVVATIMATTPFLLYSIYFVARDLRPEYT